MSKRNSAKKTQGDGWTLVSACPRCGKPSDRCACGKTEEPEHGVKPVIRLRMERRNGKAVTVLAAAGIHPEGLQELARDLKSACASGGTVKDAAIELQGDHREKLRPILAQRGLVVKG